LTPKRPIAIVNSPPTMPRNLAKLRFRAPKQLAQPNLHRFAAGQEDKFHARLRAHALDLSKPQTPLSLHIVVNPKWKQQPGKKPHRLAYKPHTVRDLVDPEGTAKHGQIIYVFANIKTGQVIYSLVELLDVRRQSYLVCPCSDTF
jgi:hypothetical protein